MKLRERIAQNIMKHRKIVGLSQEKLAKCAGISRAYIGHIENARHSVSVDTLGKIAVALDVDAVELLRPLTD
jgi:transcriptional regulator with XRE-family HTH domain